jgi:hypothetical protein
MRVVAICIALGMAIPVGGIAAHLQAILGMNAVQTGGGDNPPPETYDCTWGEIKACFAGECVENCCPENCKPRP